MAYTHGLWSTPGFPYNDVLYGSLKCYTLSDQELKKFVKFVNEGSYTNTFTKAYNNPINCIIGLYQFPMPVNGYGQSGTISPVMFGNVQSNAQGTLMSRYNYIHCCDLAVPSGYHGNFLDYEPYSEYYIHLPFVGIKKLTNNDVLRKTLSIDYCIDFATGKSICFVSDSERVLDSYECVLGISQPLTLDSAVAKSSYESSLGTMNAISSTLGFLSIAGLTASGLGSSSLLPLAYSGINAAGNILSTIPKMNQTEMKPVTVTAPSTGIFDSMYVYLVIKTVDDPIDANFYSLYGGLSWKAETLSTLTGFTKVANIHIEGSGFSTATNDEKEEVDMLLKNGVIL